MRARAKLEKHTMSSKMFGRIESVQKFLNEGVWFGSVFFPVQVPQGRFSVAHCSRLLLARQLFIQLFLLAHVWYVL